MSRSLRPIPWAAGLAAALMAWPGVPALALVDDPAAVLKSAGLRRVENSYVLDGELDARKMEEQANKLQQQYQQAVASRDAYQASLKGAGRDRITTGIEPAGDFYFAEEEHQQYLAKNPNGYCGLKGTGIACAIPTAVAPTAATA